MRRFMPTLLALLTLGVLLSPPKVHTSTLIGPARLRCFLCLSSVDFGVLEEAVDLAGDVAFEAALGFSGGFAFGGSFGDVGLGVGAVAAAGDGDGVQRSG